jgi:hypothetical protein
MRQRNSSKDRLDQLINDGKERTMDTIEDRITAQSTKETAGPRHISKSQSLRLEKQIIRALSGADLRLVGGGCNDCSCGCHSQHTVTVTK